MSKKYTIDDVRNAFLARGYILLSNSYTNSAIKLEFICDKHKNMGIQKIDFHHFLHRGQGCIYCSKEKPNKKRISDDELKECKEQGFNHLKLGDYFYTIIIHTGIDTPYLLSAMNVADEDIPEREEDPDDDYVYTEEPETVSVSLFE